MTDLVEQRKHAQAVNTITTCLVNAKRNYHLPFGELQGKFALAIEKEINSRIDKFLQGQLENISVDELFYFQKAINDAKEPKAEPKQKPKETKVKKTKDGGRKAPSKKKAVPTRSRKSKSRS